MITLIGDVHGKYSEYANIVKGCNYSIQLGDMGFKYDILKDIDSTRHMILPGNHDNYSICYEYSHFLGDYGYTRLNTIDFFYYRGAYSIDRQYRTIGIDWWQNEQVDIESFIEARELYRSVKPDIVLSHDCPEQIAQLMLKPRQRMYQNITGWGLGELYKIHEPKLWIFGHWHESRTIIYGNTKFICLDELETYTLTKENY